MPLFYFARAAFCRCGHRESMHHITTGECAKWFCGCKEYVFSYNSD